MNVTTDEAALSAECVLGLRPEYAYVHALCTQTRDVPLPHARGLFLVRRCRCACHRAGVR